MFTAEIIPHRATANSFFSFSPKYVFVPLKRIGTRQATTKLSTVVTADRCFVFSASLLVLRLLYLMYRKLSTVL